MENFIHKNLKIIRKLLFYYFYFIIILRSQSYTQILVPKMIYPNFPIIFNLKILSYILIPFIKRILFSIYF